MSIETMPENAEERDPQQEIEETTPLLDDFQQPDGESRSRNAAAKVPEVEIHLYRCGKGPVDVFKSNLGGWEQDQLEVRSILEKYGLKSIFAFNVKKGRAVPIRFNPRNGRSVLTYRDGAVVFIDGEPQVIIYILPMESSRLLESICFELFWFKLRWSRLLSVKFG